MDERLNLPSASGAEIWMTCPAQPQFVKDLPEITEGQPDETTLAGTRIHKALCYENPLELSEEDADTYALALKFQESLLQQWQQDKEINQAVEGPREERFYFHDPTTLKVVTSGQIDRHWLAPPYLIVEDFKSQYCWNLTPSNRNKQMRIYAVLSWLEYDGVNGQPIDHVRVALNKPKIKASPLDFTDYSRQDLEFSRMQILLDLWATRQPDAKFVAGQHCNWCKGKAFCAQAGAWSMLPSVQAGNITPDKDFDMEVFVSTLDPSDLAKIISGMTVRHKIEDACKARLRKLPAEEQAMLGLKLGKPMILRPIVNTRSAFLKLRDEVKVDEDKLFTAMSFSNGPLADVLRREVGVSAKGVSQYIRETLADFIEERPCDPPLKEVKEEE